MPQTKCAAGLKSLPDFAPGGGTILWTGPVEQRKRPGRAWVAGNYIR